MATKLTFSLRTCYASRKLTGKIAETKTRYFVNQIVRKIGTRKEIERICDFSSHLIRGIHTQSFLTELIGSRFFSEACREIALAARLINNSMYPIYLGKKQIRVLMKYRKKNTNIFTLLKADYLHRKISRYTLKGKQINEGSCCRFLLQHSIALDSFCCSKLENLIGQYRRNSNGPLSLEYGRRSSRDKHLMIYSPILYHVYFQTIFFR